MNKAAIAIIGGCAALAAIMAVGYARITRDSAAPMSEANPSAAADAVPAPAAAPAEPPAAMAATCPHQEAQIVGDWVATGDNAPFQQMAFAAEGEGDAKVRSFRSWLNDRPEIIDGRWVMRAAAGQCTLVITDENADRAAQSFAIASISARALVLRSDYFADGAVYQRPAQ